jgi:ubiquinone/menaquinone biosynthesis C-methylase UbiE
MTCAPELCCDFAGSYDLSRLPQIKKLEQAALGCDYGGTSWTTRQQVDLILESLQLEATSQLLDIGSGAGWPGLLLGQLSDCDVTLLDIPLNALAQAAERAVKDGMEETVNIVSGSGTALPFQDAAFDRIGHSDVLCCLPEKLQLLKEARRVSRDNARMHFSVILPADDLSQDVYDKVLATGPPFIGVDGTYSELLVESGWRTLERVDVTAEYKNSLQRLVNGIRENEAELTELLGEDELTSKREHREDQIDLIDKGYMIREAYVATVSPD